MKNLPEKNCILIIDDDFINRELLKNIFSAQYTFEEASNGKEGLLQIERNVEKLCAVILDVEMPEMNGIELLEIIAERGITEKVPTFLITAHDDDHLVEKAYRLGVVDVVSKPVTPVIIQKRVRTVIELFSARERLKETVKGQERKLSENAQKMDNLHRDTLEALATAIEFRDVDSGEHVNRIYSMTKYILLHTAFGEGLDEEEIEHIARGSIMHDVGKITISDIILNKPGRLTKEEFEVMKLHTVKGAELLEHISDIHTDASYKYSCDIARHHHERWDGKGYPDGLLGDEISVASQVVSIVDVYDALVSPRVYKKAFSHDEAVAMIQNGECGCFNPKLVACFIEAEPVIRNWYLSDTTDETLKALTENHPKAGALYSDSAKTDEKINMADSVVDVMLLMTAVQTAYDMIIAVNLTKNTYSIMDYDRFLTHCADYSGIFDDLIALGSASIPISHRREFHDTFCRENLLKAYGEGKKSVRLEHPQYSDDGALHWVLTKVLFMEDSRTGDVLQITLSQYIDDEYQEREHTRKILTDALNLAEQANNAKYDFLSKMSHDIRTPLNAIIGMTTIIAANLDNKEKINDCLMKIGLSSKHLLGMINDVLDFSKIENGSLSIHKTDFNLRDFIAELSHDVQLLAQGKQQMVTVTVDDMVGTSYVGDEYRIRQILMNLLDNAYRYTEENGTFSLTVRNTRHTEEYDVLCFEVQDQGQGIRKEFLNQIFEPFAQDHPDDNIGSAGLGLAISRNLAHLMNGDLAVTSTEGQGSCFTFEIPLERGNLTAYSETINKDLHVLVVDDEMAVCEHTAILLHNMGIMAEIANNGVDAVKMVQANLGTQREFDVAIVDWQMPDMDGIETVRQIRNVVGQNVLVVVMSAFDWTDIEEEARAAGVDLFIAKPIYETNLRTAIACSEKMIKNKTNITFEGETVLIAEDNTFNAEVAKAILEMKNLRVEIAENGQLAYEQFVNAPVGTYTAVFMDIMMPVMNGHEATRAIRESKHPEAKTIPIYAMTANAFHNDILEAKLAGMNGHIAKPVDFDEVARTLQTIIKNNKWKNFPAGGGVYTMNNCEILTKAGIDTESLMTRLMGNASLVKIFVNKFVEDNTFSDLVDAFAAKDMKQAELASHTLKGMCGNMSLLNLYDLFTEQVNLIRRGEFEKAADYMPKLETTYQETIQKMREWLSLQ